jgi:hypothetical protein
MGKRKAIVKEPTFWNKDGRYIVPYGHSTFKELQNEYPDISVIFIKHSSPMSICKELFNPREFENKTPNYYIIDEEEMTPEICSKIKKFKINLRGREIFWDGINFLHRDTILCEECFQIGILTPKRGCLTHIPKCKHIGIKSSSTCHYCFAKSFASFWQEIVSQIVITKETEHLHLLHKHSKHKYDFKCKKCNHIFSPSLDSLSTGSIWCHYCAGKRLCGEENCKTCFDKSFASFEITKRQCIRTLENLRLLFKWSNKKYDFDCNNCKHIFPSSLNNVSRGQWCSYCSNPPKRLCGKENCDKCYQKSFASFDPIKRDCIQTSESLLLIFKHSHFKYEFKCLECTHVFQTSLDFVVKGTWCPFCANLKLCGEAECNICFEKSFASFHAVKRNCIQTKQNLLLVFKHSGEIYDFKCNKCAHLFSASPHSVSQSHWCRYCRGYVCGQETCKICDKQCEMALCRKKAQKKTKITKLWYCEEHFKDCIKRNPNETPLIYRAKISLEIYTLAELQRVCMDNDGDGFYWSNPTNWDCRMIPGLSYRPDNLFCFDNNFQLLVYADDLTLNMNKLRYVLILEILEEGRHQHSKHRNISDEERERDIRKVFDVYNIPVGFLYVSMAHNKHFTPHPDDVFFYKSSSGEYEVLPKRIQSFSTRINEIRDTLNFIFENKLNESKWIGH